MNETEIVDMHKKIFNMMEQVRKDTIEFYYGMRKRHSHRFDRGYIFLGDDKYIFVPLCPRGSKRNKTTTVGLFFDIKNNKSYVLIIYSIESGHEDPSQEKEVYENIVNKLKAQPKDTNKYVKRFEAVVHSVNNNMVKDTQQYLQTHLSCILVALSCHPGMRYSRSDFQKMIKRQIEGGHITQYGLESYRAI